jgi:hypothetical protein
MVAALGQLVTHFCPCSIRELSTVHEKGLVPGVVTAYLREASRVPKGLAC